MSKESCGGLTKSSNHLEGAITEYDDDDTEDNGDETQRHSSDRKCECLVSLDLVQPYKTATAIAVLIEAKWD